jgi:hypothetical protein
MVAGFAKQSGIAFRRHTHVTIARRPFKVASYIRRTELPKETGASRRIDVNFIARVAKWTRASSVLLATSISRRGSSPGPVSSALAANRRHFAFRSLGPPH